jgi:hypothetical protein
MQVPLRTSMNCCTRCKFGHHFGAARGARPRSGGVITHVAALLLQGFQLLCRREVVLGFLLQRVPSMGSAVTKVGPAGEGGDARRSAGGLSEPGRDSGSIARMTIRLSVRVRAKIDKRPSWTEPDYQGCIVHSCPFGESW